MILITIRGRKDTLAVGDEKGKVIKENWKQYKLKKIPDCPMEIHGFDRQVWSGMISDINSFEETEISKPIIEQKDDNFLKEHESFIKKTPQEKVIAAKVYIETAWTAFGNAGSIPKDVMDNINKDLATFYFRNQNRMYPLWGIITKHVPLNKQAGSPINSSLYRAVRGMAISGK